MKTDERKSFLKQLLPGADMCGCMTAYVPKDSIVVFDFGSIVKE